VARASGCDPRASDIVAREIWAAERTFALPREAIIYENAKLQLDTLRGVRDEFVDAGIWCPSEATLSASLYWPVVPEAPAENPLSSFCRKFSGRCKSGELSHVQARFPRAGVL